MSNGWMPPGSTGGGEPPGQEQGPPSPPPSPGQPPGPFPYPPPYTPVPYPSLAAPTDNEAIAALVLGILSCLCCAILGPVAIVLGSRSRQRIASSQGMLAGSGLAVAGLVLGSVGTVFLGLEILYVLVVALAAFARGG
ncbi:MAG TPA: DUF4190 domain-containing protein [Candidatus Dormibacteraeota bacterium]|nr:DUF4190 domain-containing protein [Candidatus Dormibacteraeota bacterium]